MTYNTAQGKGGGVYVRDGFINATNSSVVNNTATTNAGGLYLERGVVPLSGHPGKREPSGADLPAVFALMPAPA